VKPVLTADEYRRIDKAYTGDLTQAMDRAGYAVALAAVRAGAGYGKRVAVLAGSGNNGGDGYVAARYLRDRGADVVIHALDIPKAEVARDAARLARRAGVPLTDLGVPDREDLIIDALFGGGVRDGLPLEVFPWIRAETPVVAVDFPTGLDPNTGKVEERAFTAVETVTFGALKTGHVLGVGPDHCGIVTVADIGISGGEPSMFVTEESDTVRPQRARTAHKWSAGSVLIVGGSAGMTGAVVIAARSALAFGAGSVAIASPDRGAVAASSVEFPTFHLDDDTLEPERYDVVVFGPGLGDDDRDSASALLSGADKVVVDAGGLVPETLDALARSGATPILTPHKGEFARVAGSGGGAFAVRALANKVGGVALLKGNPTKISDGGPPNLIDTGGPELATIGTGDVLAGMIAAVWARGAEPLDAALTAAYFHGVAGSELALSGPLTASGLADHVGRYAYPA
jgi:ADP-dependent NAD(P)H-hydrate dehydratase / NAD(P)H-hydrate epimerase